MPLKSYKSIQNFFDQRLDLLLKHEVENSLLLGLLKSNPHEELRGKCGIYEWHENNKALVIGVQYHFNLIIAKLDGHSHNYYEKFATSLSQLNLQLPGVIGPEENLELFYTPYSQLRSLTPSVNFKQFVFELTHLKPVKISEGKIIQADMTHLSCVEQWIHKFRIEAMGKNDFSPCERMAYQMIKNGTIYLWLINDKPVSMVAKVRPTNNGITIAYVYTPKDKRGKGYASSVVYSLSQKLLNEGYKFCTLFTDRSNPTSNKIYKNMGYKEVTKFCEVTFKS